MTREQAQAENTRINRVHSFLRDTLGCEVERVQDRDGVFYTVYTLYSCAGRSVAYKWLRFSHYPRELLVITENLTTDQLFSEVWEELPSQLAHLAA